MRLFRYCVGVYLAQVVDTRFCAKVVKDPILSATLAQFINFTIRVIQVTKHQGVGGAGLDAGRGHIAIDYFTSLSSNLSDRPADALHAEAALLHDAAATNRDIRVQLVPQGLWPYRLPEVEEPYVPGIVVGAESCADATVVYLNVQTFVVMVGSEHRAYRLAGCILTMLAEHRHKPCLHLRELTFPIPLDANPLDCPALEEVVGLIEGDIILSLT
jgi:hypothetical protein